MNIINKLIKVENGVISWIGRRELVTRLILSCVLDLPLVILDTVLSLFCTIFTDDVSC